ncbi:zf-TFIIB domain-containing protein [Phycicoccus sp. M110.8]|uniref:TFIIB-type zinc ribbon-containing protein n=1 Tax=Phycicoccus sp. M110.8 TaxID=3075433 RepID=UPI0028FDB96E|nr:zf-TFIIB domain-containing protein [Phycicoccus sp. M110.8]MDU0313363.1 zf-TFIIB domain-containing protein [Phycicoccus sp. M110.8]
MSTLTCPKCGSEMRSYERNQVHVDQCTGCGGLFLDRGELEALVAAENAWHAQVPPQAGPPQGEQYQGQPPYQGQQYQRQPQYQQGQNPWQQPPAQGHPAPYRATSKSPYGSHGQRRRKSFLSELFD